MAIWDIFRKNRVGQLNSGAPRRERPRRGLEAQRAAREEEILRPRILTLYPENAEARRLLANVDAALNPIFDATEPGVDAQGTFMNGVYEAKRRRAQADLLSEHQRRVNEIENWEAELRGVIAKNELILGQLGSRIRDRSLLVQAQPAAEAPQGGTNEGGENHA